MIDSRLWRGCPVLVTGHTGFKGSWLVHWLHGLGARVHGVALDPVAGPSMYSITSVAKALDGDWRADVTDISALAPVLQRAAPRVVFHLAAQPLVRESYADPLRTFATNAMGTANLLEAVRSVPSVRAVVVVTTDKVYANREWHYPYRETDPLGGHDPYSASKAAAEIVAESFRLSFFTSPAGDLARIATARAGNVIGGGDWSRDRLLPDCLAAFAAGQPVTLRRPDSVRPWQHVLEPLAGYIALAEQLLGEDGAAFARAWNFAPGPEDNATVEEVARMAADVFDPEARVEAVPDHSGGHEAGLLRLDATLARTLLGWRPRWDLRTAIERTVAWDAAWRQGADMARVTREQILAFGASTS